MSKYKLSPWHDGSVNPVHKGVYRILYDRDDEYKWYSWWDGKYFNGGWLSIERATENKFFVYKHSPYDDKPIKWRGILKD